MPADTETGAHPDTACDTAYDVALISPYPRLGSRHDGSSGVASYTANLAHALADEGARVVVVAPEEPGEPAVGHDGPVEVRRAFRDGRAGAVPAALAAARRTGAPQVHLQLELLLYAGAAGLPATAAGLVAHRRAGGRSPGRTTLTMHQVVDPATVTRDYTAMHRVAVPPWAARRAIDTVQRLLPTLVDEVVVHEPSFTAAVPGATVVPHGIEVPDGPAAPRAQAQRAARRALGVPEDGLLALCFGFVAPYKGLETALEAAAVTGPDVHVVVAGGPHPRHAASGDTYAADLERRHGDHARFTGYVPDGQVAEWFRAADVLLLPYPQPHASSGPLALALAHRTPVLLSPRLADVVAADPALRVDGGTPADWAARLDHLVSGPGALDRLREVVDAMAADRTWPAVARRHLDLYRAHLSGPTSKEGAVDAQRTPAADHAPA